MFVAMRNMTIKALVLVVGFLASSWLQPVSHAGFSPESPWVIGKKEWRKSTAGYISETSNIKGSKIQVFVSCPAKSFYLVVGKIGNYSGTEFKEVLKTEPKKCVQQLAKNSPNWIPTASFESSNLESGIYLIRINDSDGFKSFIPLIIKDNNQRSKSLFVLPTMTMHAYNSWSGSNTYKGKNGFEGRLRVVNFSSPLDSGFGTGKYWKYVHPLVIELERLNIGIDYVTDVDIHFFPNLLENRAVYISAGHDEYWTAKERDSVIKARKAGMNLLFFGANAGYWQTRLTKDRANSSIVMEIYKNKEEDPKKESSTIRFRDAGYSESELNGLQYTCFPAKGGFNSFDKTFFGFAEMSAQDFINLNKVVGPEVDEVPRVNKFSGKVRVVAAGEVKCGNRRIFPKIGRVNMIYGTSGEGGGVFSVGTMGWVLKGLESGADKPVKEAVARVTRNVVLRGIQGPFTS